MADYQRMYALLCSEVSKALDSIPEAEPFLDLRRRLLDALEQAENIYIDTAEDDRTPG